ncbi:hypothetical protein DPMN_071876 [Dreissena polymorpha]|uniref:Uncharacterized protein n=1 Tax=Dreissena polymorpha TaxID=45954 RepID=A0A9D3Z334_DREPO|nr:hypothetical protein DPMN_071876 [Dreissena polymorpha]
MKNHINDALSLLSMLEMQASTRTPERLKEVQKKALLTIKEQVGVLKKGIEAVEESLMQTAVTHLSSEEEGSKSSHTGQ